VYAAGVMLYELLTGSVPFRSPSPVVVMTAHLTERPEPPSSRQRARPIAPALEAVVLHALAKAPSARYASAAALAAALESAQRSPSDVASIAPPRSNDADLATRDTDLQLAPPASRDSSTSPGEQPARLWLLVAIVAALVGIAVGLLAGGRPG